MPDENGCEFPETFSDLDSFYRGIKSNQLTSTRFKTGAFTPKIVADNGQSGLYKTESLSADFAGCCTPEEALNRQVGFVALAVATKVDLESKAVKPVQETVPNNPAHTGIDFGIRGLPRAEVESRRLRLSRELRKIFHVGLIAEL